MLSLLESDVHLTDELIVVNKTISVCVNHVHQLINLIILKAKVKLVDALSELGATNGSITIRVEVLECCIQIKILNVEGSGYLVNHFVESHLSDVSSLKLSTEDSQVYFTNT